MTLMEISSEGCRERGTPVLETERLVLRAPRLGDAKAVAAQANDRRIAENTARIPHPYRASDAEDFIEGANRGAETVFLITLRNGAVIGSCGLMDAAGQSPEIGYWLGAKFWSKGYGTEATRALIDHAFEDLDHEALQSSARVTNPASRRVLEKCGFQWTASGCTGCGRSTHRCRSTASGSTADCGPR